MKSFITAALLTLLPLVSAVAFALEDGALVGKWQLVEVARDADGTPCPFITEQLEFTRDGKMISPTMPVPFRYRVNPGSAEAAKVVAKYPDLKGMDLMLALVGNQTDWSRAPIVYGVQIKGDRLTMKVSGFTPAQYRKK